MILFCNSSALSSGRCFLFCRFGNRGGQELLWCQVLVDAHLSNDSSVKWHKQNEYNTITGTRTETTVKKVRKTKCQMKSLNHRNDPRQPKEPRNLQQSRKVKKRRKKKRRRTTKNIEAGELACLARSATGEYRIESGGLTSFCSKFSSWQFCKNKK